MPNQLAPSAAAGARDMPPLVVVHDAGEAEPRGGADILLSRIGGTPRRVRRGEFLYRVGASFQALYAVRAGSFKSVLLTEDGREQITGFYLAGDVLGLDGIGAESYAGDAVALEDGEVVEIPFRELDALAGRDPGLQRSLFRMLASEIQHKRSLMLLLGSMRAEERLAAFLIDLSQRMAARGFSAQRFILRMTREEIGSLLGLKLETVSRILSRFQGEGLILVRNREIDILAMGDLRGVIGRGELRRERQAA